MTFHSLSRHCTIRLHFHGLRYGCCTAIKSSGRQELHLTRYITSIPPNPIPEIALNQVFSFLLVFENEICKPRYKFDGWSEVPTQNNTRQPVPFLVRALSTELFDRPTNGEYRLSMVGNAQLWWSSTWHAKFERVAEFKVPFEPVAPKTPGR